ncbi:MAG: YfcE family phosphodiesterase [Promethearchaeota archaeon]
MHRTNVLVIGDSHVPDRAAGVPSEVRAELDRLADGDPFDLVMCTGDIVTSPEVVEYFRGFSPDPESFHVVQGNMDYFAGVTNPTVREVAVNVGSSGEARVGLFHGHQIHPRGDREKIIKFAKKLGANVIVSGHSHADDVYLDAKEGILLLNPGSCTGAWSFVASGVPSFMRVVFSSEPASVVVELFKFPPARGDPVVETWNFGLENGRVNKVNNG